MKRDIVSAQETLFIRTSKVTSKCGWVETSRHSDMIYTVPALNNSNTRPCGFRVPPCEHPGLMPELTIFVLNLILRKQDKNPRFRFVPVNDYEELWHNDTNVTDLTALGLLRNLSIDFSSVDTGLYPVRMSLFRQIGPIFGYNYILLYRRSVPVVNLDLLKILPWKSYGMVVLIGIIISSGRFYASKENNRFSLLWGRLFTRNQIWFAFFVGLFFKYLSSQLVLIFNNSMPEKPQRIGDAHSMMDSIRGGSYKVITNWNLMYRRALKGLPENPPILIPSEDTSMRLVLSAKDPYALLTSTDRLGIFASKYCNFSIAVLNGFPTIYNTIYYAKNFLDLGRSQLWRNEIKVIKQEYEYLMKKYYPPKLCNAIRPIPNKETKPLTLEQLQAIFWLLAGSFGFGVLLFGLEIVKWWLHRRLSDTYELEKGSVMESAFRSIVFGTAL